MRLTKGFADRQEENSQVAEPGARDEELELALVEFRSSIHAWSEAAYSQPRSMQAAVLRQKAWRLVAGWALGCALLAATVSGGVYEFHHREQMERIAARAAEQQRQLAAQRARIQAREEEELLAGVDSDVSREVPSAMEPLAQLMEGN